MRFDIAYHGGGRTFWVETQDAVLIFSDGKWITTGYSHSRAWRAALEAAR